MFHYTVETNKNVDEAITSLENNLKEEKFGVLWQLNMQEKLQEKGIDFDQKYHILEVCNPVEAKTCTKRKLHYRLFLALQNSGLRRGRENKNWVTETYGINWDGG